MKTEKTYNIDEIIVAHTMINTDIYIETTNNRGTIAFFQNLNKNLECNNKKYITILRDINNEKYLYVDRFNISDNTMVHRNKYQPKRSNTKIL